VAAVAPRVRLPALFRAVYPLYFLTKTRYDYYMKNQNPYVQTLLEKGYTVAECHTPAPKKQFPLTIYGRTYETEEAYNEAIADFLNGN